MISRTWHGAVPLKYKNRFYQYEIETGVKETLETEGCLASYLKVVDQNNYAHFFLCSIWSDMNAVRRFAGENPQIAVTYPKDHEYKLISDPIVILQEVTTCENPLE